MKAFCLAKTYGASFAPYARLITKPIAGSVRVAVAGSETTAFTLDATTGRLTFITAPTAGAAITAGFRFDVPVRFDTDFLEIDHSAFEAGEMPRRSPASTPPRPRMAQASSRSSAPTT